MACAEKQYCGPWADPEPETMTFKVKARQHGRYPTNVRNQAGKVRYLQDAIKGIEC